MKADFEEKSEIAFQLDKDNKRIREDNRHIVANNTTLLEELHEIKSILHETEEKNIELAQEKEILAQENKVFELNFTKLTTALESATVENNSLLEYKTHAMEEIKNLEAVLTSSQNSLNELQQEKTTFDAKISEWRFKVIEMQLERDTARSELKEYMHQVQLEFESNLQKQDQYTTEQRQIQLQYNLMKESKDAVAIEMELKVRQLHDLTDEIDDYKEKIEAMSKKLAQQAMELDSLHHFMMNNVTGGQPVTVDETGVLGFQNIAPVLHTSHDLGEVLPNIPLKLDNIPTELHDLIQEEVKHLDATLDINVTDTINKIIASLRPTEAGAVSTATNKRFGSMFARGPDTRPIPIRHNRQGSMMVTGASSNDLRNSLSEKKQDSISAPAPVPASRLLQGSFAAPAPLINKPAEETHEEEEEEVDVAPELTEQLSGLLTGMLQRHESIQTRRASITRAVQLKASGRAPSTRFSSSSNVPSLETLLDEKEEEDLTVPTKRRNAVHALPDTYAKAKVVVEEIEIAPKRIEKGETLSPMEQSLKDALMCALTASVGSVMAKKATNALTPVIALYGMLLAESMEVCNMLVLLLISCINLHHDYRDFGML